MDIYNYLKNNQNIPYTIFLNALKNDRFFHAYLLSGFSGTPLLEIAKFIAKSIIQNKNNYFEFDELIDYKVESQTYGDLIILDGKKDQIKIDDIRNLESRFSKTAIEKLGVKIYIVNLIENMNVDAINALLKFLEEPSENTFAFLTTENEHRVLSTIKSRTQLIHFSPLNRIELINDAIKLGTPSLDSFILSYFYNDPNVIYDKTYEEDYLNAKSNVFIILDNLSNKHVARLETEKNVLKSLKSKTAIRFFIDILIVLFKETLSYKVTNSTILSNDVEILDLIYDNSINIDKDILLLMNYRNELNYNINTNLLILNLVEKVFGV